MPKISIIDVAIEHNSEVFVECNAANMHGIYQFD